MLLHIISTPFLENFSQLTPFLLFYFIFFGLGKYVYVFDHYPWGALPLICDVIRAHISPFSGGYWRLGKHVRRNHTSFFLISREASEKNPISWEIGLKTSPFPLFLGKILQRQTAKKYILSRENGNAHAAPLYIRVGGGGGRRSVIYWNPLWMV